MLVPWYAGEGRAQRPASVGMVLAGHWRSHYSRPGNITQPGDPRQSSPLNCEDRSEVRGVADSLKAFLFLSLYGIRGLYLLDGSHPYAIKTHRLARQEIPPNGGLEQCLHSRRELGQQHHDPNQPMRAKPRWSSTNESGEL